MNNFFNPRFLTITLLILAGVITRFLPHPPNFTPIAAIALFAGAKFNTKIHAFAVTLLAMLISDIIIGFHNTLWAVYISLIITVLMGIKMKSRQNSLNVVVTSLLSSVIFFLITNFAVWLMNDFYPKNMMGLGMSYYFALPFFSNSILADLGFSTVLFGTYYFAQKKYPVLA